MPVPGCRCSVPLFTENHQLELRFKGRQISGSLIYEKSGELAIRTVPFGEGRAVQTSLFDNLRDSLNQNKVYAEYRRCNYLCSFETRLLSAEADLSCEKHSVVVNLEMPQRIKRVLRTPVS